MRVAVTVKFAFSAAVGMVRAACSVLCKHYNAPQVKLPAASWIICKDKGKICQDESIFGPKAKAKPQNADGKLAKAAQ